MLCDRGFCWCTAVIAPGTRLSSSSLVLAAAVPVRGCLLREEASRTRPSSRLASTSGSAAAMMALTTATPSRGLARGLPRNSTCGMLDALMPPMHTAGTPPWPRSTRVARVCLRPSGPITFLVFVLLYWQQVSTVVAVLHGREGRVGRAFVWRRWCLSPGSRRPARTP